jgi:predicted nucleic acid-binding Zn ribbon protein
MTKHDAKKKVGSVREVPDASSHRVGDILGGLLRRLGLEEGVARQDAVRRWETVVGEAIAAVTEATAVSGDTLFVRVASSAWMSELNLMRHEILRRLNAGQSAGRVERIVFTLWEKPPTAPSGEGQRG